MRYFIPVSCLLLIVSCNTAKNPDDNELYEKAMKIHKNVITIDTHVDINVKNFTDSLNYNDKLNTQVNLPKMQSGGLDVAWFIVYTAQDSLSDSGFARAADNAMQKFSAIHRLCEVYAPDKIGLALTSEKVRELHAANKLVAMIGVENAYPMGTDLSNFEKYHQLGARYISLAHNGHSQFCDSHTGEAEGKWLYNGLSDIGVEAVNEMNRIGIIIDVSHISKAAMLQVAAQSKAPIIASHSAARALCDQSRNLDDEQLDRLKENGGVVQTVALDEFLNKEKSRERNRYMESVHKKIADSLGIAWYKRGELDTLKEKALESYLENYPRVNALASNIASKDPDAPPAVSVKDLADHIDYMVGRIGIDHVGISSDFDGGGGIEGWADASETFNVTLELVKRGYSEEDITKLWGGNLLRVLDQVQKIARAGNKG
jgi:membrane dipeptidase